MKDRRFSFNVFFRFNTFLTAVRSGTYPRAKNNTSIGSKYIAHYATNQKT
jgi:hypothetical protein